jgi:hypothetical protein
MAGVAAGFRIGPDHPAVTVLGRPQKQDRHRSGATSADQHRLSTNCAAMCHLWIKALDILEFDVAAIEIGY